MSDGGTYTYTDVSFEATNGTPDQKSFDGVSGVESEVAVNAEVTNLYPKARGPDSGALTRTINNVNATDVRITLAVNGLYEQLTSQDRAGDVVATDLVYNVQITNKNGAIIVNNTRKKHDKTNSSAQWSIKYPLDNNGPWNVKVSKITNDSTKGTLKNDLYWASYTEIVGYKMTYPNTAAVCVRASASAFNNSVPSRAYHIKGLKIEVPSNYDPTTRSYTGLWNGTFKVAWTDNPAWIFRDLIENDRYGIKRFFSPNTQLNDLVDKWTLYNIAQYCDQLVDDGRGGMEPRYTFNGQIMGAGQALQVIQAIASTFAGMSYWSSGMVFATADRLQDPAKLITQANTIGGKIIYATGSNQERHSVAYITWYDPEDYNRARIEPVYDWDLYKQYGERPINKVAYGCTSRGQAQRLGLWTLATEAEQWTATAEVGIDCYDLLPNDWVKVADPSLMGIRFSGRIKNINGNSVTLDAPVSLSNDETYTISIIDKAGKEVTRAITSRGTSDTVTLQSSINANDFVDFAVWAIAGTDASPKIFSVQSITKNDDNTGFTLQLREINPQKYSIIDNSVRIDPVPNRKINRGSLPSPTGLEIVEHSYTSNNTVFSKLSFSWSNSGCPEAQAFEAQYTDPSGNIVRYEPQKSFSIDVSVASKGLYQFRVRSTTKDGRVSEWAEKSFTAVGSTYQPEPPTNFTVAGGYRCCSLSWTVPNDAYVGYFEVYQLKVTENEANNIVDNADLIAKLYASNYNTAANLDASQLYRYWIRSVNINGNSFSDLVGPVNAMTEGIQTPDIPDNVITRPKLDSVLNQKIDISDDALVTLASAAANNSTNIFNNKVTSDRGFAEVRQDINTAIDTVNGSIAQLETVVNSKYDETNAKIVQANQTIANNQSAQAAVNNTIYSQIGDNSAAIQQNAAAITTLDGECNSQYTLRLDSNGKIAGYGLWNNGNTSEFAIKADSFKVVGDNNQAYPVFAVDTANHTVGISGNLFVYGAQNAGSGWIAGDYINANSVITLADGSIELNGTNGTIKVLDPQNKTSGTYTYISSGRVNQYVNGNLMRSLTSVETGQCTNNTWCDLNGKFSQQPKIIVSPKTLQCFNTSYGEQNQSFKCDVSAVESTGANTWRFKPIAQLVVTGGENNISTPASVQAYLNTAMYSSITVETGSVSTGANCIGISANINYGALACHPLYDDVGNVFGYKTYSTIVKARLAYKINSASSWSYGSWSSEQTLAYNQTKTETLDQSVTSGDYSIKIQLEITRTNDSHTKNGNAYPMQYLFVSNIAINKGSATTLATGTLNYIAVGL